MEKVIVAFAGAQNGKRIREILERSGTAACLLCTSADQVRRTVHEQQVEAVICGYKFADGTAERLYEDLPAFCRMLMVASRSMLELVRARPNRRSEEERELLLRAKAKLMAEGLSEEEAHRALQKKSMAAGVRLAQAARMVLERR